MRTSPSNRARVGCREPFSRLRIGESSEIRGMTLSTRRTETEERDSIRDEDRWLQRTQSGRDLRPEPRPLVSIAPSGRLVVASTMGITSRDPRDDQGPFVLPEADLRQRRRKGIKRNQDRIGLGNFVENNHIRLRMARGEGRERLGETGSDPVDSIGRHRRRAGTEEGATRHVGWKRMEGDPVSYWRVLGPTKRLIDPDRNRAS
ncbi:hypothetical protein C8F01DRAFT_691502 [Mycena amicta]|nr:hypothetical protein C8F01DRAFT_691502 [Mycena amicta]